MKKTVTHRLVLTLTLVSLLGMTTYFVMQNFRDNLVFFLSPTEILEAPHKAAKRARLGGMIKKNSIQIISQKEHRLRFIVSDLNKEITVEYQGFLPDLFREGQGLVTEGYFDQELQVFVARTVLAKHDENYRPPQMQKELSKHHGANSLKNSEIPIQFQVVDLETKAKLPERTLIREDNDDLQFSKTHSLKEDR